MNQAGASDGWLTQDALWLVSKTVSDKLRAHLLSQGIEGIPSSNTAVFTVLQDHGIALPTPEGKAIWKATVTSDAGWSHSFTFLKLSPALIWEAADRPAAFAGRVQVEQEELSEPPPHAPTASETQDIATGEAVAAGMMPSASPIADNSLGALLDLLDTPVGSPALALSSSPEPKSKAEPPSPNAPTKASYEPPPEPSGEHFMAWLRQSIQTRKLVINDAKALVAYREVPYEEVLKQPLICSRSAVGERWRMTLQRLSDSALQSCEQMVDTFDMAMTLVAAGYGVAAAPARRLACYANNGIVFRPLAGVPTIVMAYLLRQDVSLADSQARFVRRARLLA